MILKKLRSCFLLLFCNNAIRELALKKIQSMKFNASVTAAPQQMGQIVFDFKATNK